MHYDSLLSKLVAWAPDRPTAIARLARALDEYQVTGVRTTIPFFRWLMEEPDFARGQFDTTYLDRVLGARNHEPFVNPDAGLDETAAIAAAVHAYLTPPARSDETFGGDIGQRSSSAWVWAGRRDALG
jgi:acetyl/propionyl-CoA carboxylase alpha subunit